MHSDLIDAGWTDEHWNRIYSVVSEEAQKARVGAQVFGQVGPLDRTTVAVPPYTLYTRPNPRPLPRPAPQLRLEVNSDPTLFLSKISVNIYLRSRELADPDMNAALTAFRRAANYIARVEDALVFNGRTGPNRPPAWGTAGIPDVYQVTGDGAPAGIMPFLLGLGGRQFQRIFAVPVGGTLGDFVVTAVVRAISRLENAGQLGPFACILSPVLFAAICTPNTALVLPRDRILPFLQGPLVRSSTLLNPWGVVVSLSANPIELVVADDIHVSFLQRTEEARWAFQISERVALRIKEPSAICIMV
jgi:uncharacterized linocin/CFP29 family protein